MVEHRFYINELPEERTVVPIIPRSIHDFGIIGDLPEYPGTNCIIKLPEMSKRNLKAFKKLKLGQVTTAIVVKVDEETRNVDLSRRQMPPSEVAETLAKYYKAKKIASLVQALSTEPDVQHQIYEDVIWPLYTEDKTAYDVILDGTPIPHTTVIPYDILTAEIAERIKPETITTSVKFQMQSTDINGVKIIQEACIAAGIPITCIAPPTYMASFTSTSVRVSYDTIRNAFEQMRRILVDSGGVFIGNVDAPAEDFDDESN